RRREAADRRLCEEPSRPARDRAALHGDRAGHGHAEGALPGPRGGAAISARLHRGDEGLGLRRRRAQAQQPARCRGRATRDELALQPLGPAKAGTHITNLEQAALDSRLRGNERLLLSSLVPLSSPWAPAAAHAGAAGGRARSRTIGLGFLVRAGAHLVEGRLARTFAPVPLTPTLSPQAGRGSARSVGCGGRSTSAAST